MLIRFLERRWFIRTAGRWPWKLEPAQKCVISYLPNGLALKIDGAQAMDLVFAAAGYLPRGCVRGRVTRPKRFYRRVGCCAIAVQILVIVANVQTHALKTEVEQGFVSTANGRGSGGLSQEGSLCYQ